MPKKVINGIIMYSVKHPYADRQRIFAPEYLDYRLKLFREITLKSLIAQTDRDFNVFLLHSVDLPGNYQRVFREMEKEYPFIKNVWLADGTDYTVAPDMGDVDFHDGVSVNFRIDNDDALPVDFIARLRKFAYAEFAGYVINIPKINIVQRVGKDRYMLAPCDFVMNSIGLACVTAKENYSNIMRMGNHVNVRFDRPAVLLPGDGGLQVINGNNVSNFMRKKGRVHSSDEIIGALARAGYPEIDLSILKITRPKFTKHGGPLGRILYHIGKGFRLMFIR